MKKNNTNFPKRGYSLDTGDKKAIAKEKQEQKTKLRKGNKLDVKGIEKE